jgi:hypothetical protein
MLKVEVIEVLKSYNPRYTYTGGIRSHDPHLGRLRQYHCTTPLGLIVEVFYSRNPMYTYIHRD